MSDFTVHRYGTDAYGRAVLMTVYMHDWFERYVAELGWRPQIAQGAFMARLGGGARASEGAHDEAGCLDLLTEGRTTSQIDHMVNTARRLGAGAYRRDRTTRHGNMPPHMHLTLGTDRPLSPMAQILWGSYLSGGDGLAAAAGRPGNAPDYEWRPNPLVTVPPEEDDMPLTDADIAKVAAAVWQATDQDGHHRGATLYGCFKLLQRIVKKIGA
jgi:hypothetical protein